MGQHRAIVVGGGMGGLVTARVLADHFDEVLILDRDTIPDGSEVRAGAPQGNHFHTILPGGLEILEALLPGLASDLEAHGSQVPESHQFYFITPQGKSYSQLVHMPEPPPPISGMIRTHQQTRGLLERCVRDHVERVPNVRTRYQAMVRELVVDGERVCGVRIDGTDETIDADLVMDATGRVSRTLGWLDGLGFERPRESRIECDFAYATVRLRPADPARFADVGCLIRGDLEHPLRGGGLVRMEDDTLLAMLAGRQGDHPPTDLEGIRAYAATLAGSQVHDALIDAEIVVEPQQFKFPREIRRHYRELERFPEGLLPIADAFCHFNPGFGQGMSSAARQARALGEVLTRRAERGEGLDGLWREFFEAAHQEVRAPWLLAALGDFEHPGTKGDFPMEEQAAIAALGGLRERAIAGDWKAAGTLANLALMRVPLSVLDEDMTPAPEAVPA
ncbi:MAG TPA: FAD-dependent monooxygenase [Pseudomonadales bacterium]|nr:FAD-dependent monooxygenase [Pseudomonadales bacterium]